MRKTKSIRGIEIQKVVSQKNRLVRIAKKAVLVSAIAAALPAFSQSAPDRAKQSPLDGTWELVSGQPLPKGARDIKIISAGHFMFAAYDTQSGKPLYAAGGTFTLNGNSYTEHVDFMSEKISAGMIGKEQHFTVRFEGDDAFIQTGTRSNGKYLSEVWKRAK